MANFWLIYKQMTEKEMNHSLTGLFKLKKITNLNQNSELHSARAKKNTEGIVYKQIKGMPQGSNWEAVKKMLRFFSGF